MRMFNADGSEGKMCGNGIRCVGKYVSDADQAPVTELGPRISCHSMFPEGTNVEFVQVISETALRMRVWERGSGVTLSCGTGACAAAAAAVRKGFCRTGEPVRVEVDGGTLTITVREDSSVTMNGPAVTVYEGEACGI